MERHTLKIAVYVFFLKDNKILLGRRQNSGWQDGNYGVPAGHLESGETMKEGAVREANEETGLKLEESDLEYIHTMHRMNRYIDIFFVAKNWTGEPQITEPDKCDDLNWFALDNLPPNMVPSVRHVIEQYLKGSYFSEFDCHED